MDEGEGEGEGEGEDEGEDEGDGDALLCKADGREESCALDQ